MAIISSILKCMIYSRTIDPPLLAGGDGGWGAVRQRDVRWGRSLYDGNAELSLIAFSDC